MGAYTFIQIIFVGGVVIRKTFALNEIFSIVSFFLKSNNLFLHFYVAIGEELEEVCGLLRILIQRLLVKGLGSPTGGAR
jgi:hypothetical protein